MAKIPFSMRSGNSPLFKQMGSPLAKVPTDIEYKDATKKKLEDLKKEVTDITSNISDFQSNLTKKHSLYKGKKLSLKGQVNMPKADVAWNSGRPIIDLQSSASLSGSYKVNKSTTISAGANFQNTPWGRGPRLGANKAWLQSGKGTGVSARSQPFWAGVNINF